MLKPDDKKEMEKLVFGAVADALEQIVFPKFEKIDEQFDKIDRRFDNLENEVGGLREDVQGLKGGVEILDSDMGGVKMRLKVIENKIDTIADTTLVVRDHEKRLNRLEKSVV